MSRSALALAALVAFALAARPIDPHAPALAKESYRRAADAEIAFLQKALSEIAASEKPLAGRTRASKGVAVLLVRYADALGDDALKSQATKVVLTIAEKDWKGAAEESKTLKEPKADKAALKAALPKLTHAEVFAPFRGATVGGLNIDRDIKDQTKVTTKLEQMDVKLVELIGVRTVALMEFAEDIPPNRDTLKASALADARTWYKYLRETKLGARDAAIEAAKGDQADRAKLKKLLTTLNAHCSDCHGCVLTGE
jgi:hypothetical protein